MAPDRFLGKLGKTDFLANPTTVRSEKTMTKQILSILGIITLLSALPCFQVSANDSAKFKAPDLFTGLGYRDNLTLSRSAMILANREGKYDEAKDPALRKGTENWEEPQGSYFAIPALVVGIIGIVLFFNRE
jgi:hypothetical protein